MTLVHVALLGFAVWTLLIVVVAIGGHRWNQILRGRAAIHELGPDGAGEPDWYRRALRAHANCVENLPVFGAIVAVATWMGVQSDRLDALALTVLGARVAQTVTHVAFRQTRRAVSVRFSWFLVQVIAMLAMVALTYANTYADASTIAATSSAAPSAHSTK